MTAAKMDFLSAQRETLDVQVYRGLKDAVLSGRLQGGERLVQETLAEAAGTSRIPVRDALRRLEAEGLIVSRDGGYFVKGFGVEDAREICGLRLLLEPYALGLAFPNLKESTKADIRAMHEAMIEAARTDDPDSFLTYNHAFHFRMYEASGQSRLIQMIEPLWSGRPPMTAFRGPMNMELRIQEHQALLEAVEQRSLAKAKAVLRAHIESGCKELIDYIVETRAAVQTV